MKKQSTLFSKAVIFAAAAIIIFAAMPIFAFQNAMDVPQNLSSLAKVDTLLLTIAGYDYGMSREPLTQFVEIERGAYGYPQLLHQIEEKLITFLDSDASLAGKDFACRQLSVIGTKASVEILAGMLPDAKLSDMARYALERIPGPETDQVLRQALSKTQDKMKVGIINSIGQRRDSLAVPALSKLAQSSDTRMAIPAINSLGKIANEDAIKVLQKLHSKHQKELEQYVSDAYLRCADELASQNKNAKAFKIYQVMFDKNEKLTIRSAALRGMILTDKTNSGKIILSTLLNEESRIQAVSLSTIREVPEIDLAPITTELSKLAPEQKVQLIAALSDRNDPSVLNVIIAATRDEDQSVRVEALKALTNLGDESTIELLAQVAIESSDEEKEAAEKSLSRLQGETVNETIMKAIPQADARVKEILIQALGDRNVTSATDMLLASATDSDRRVRLVSLKVLGQIANPQYLAALLDLVPQLKSDNERNEAVSTIALVAKKIEDRKLRTSLVLEKYQNVPDNESKILMLAVLGKIGESNALPILKQALQSGNDDMQVAAIRALADWPTPEPMEDLLTIAKSSANVRQKVLALRGYIQLTRADQEQPDDVSIQRYKTAMSLATDINEKRMVLSGLGELQSLQALYATAEYLTDDALKEEAEVAVVNISNKSRWSNPLETKKILLQVQEQTQNKDVREDVDRMINDM